MNKEFINALEEIEKEKGIQKSVIVESIEKALVKSYEKNFDDDTNVEIKINDTTGDVTVYALKEVVETIDEVENVNTQISLDEALSLKKKSKVGNILKIKLVPKNFGRVAAQTARNIVIQKIKDAERQAIYDDYIDREREIITGDVQRIDFNNIYINLGKTEGFIPPSEQVPTENIRPGDRLKLFVSEVKSTSKGPQIILSRSSSFLIRRLFELEVPEIADGSVEIVSVAREAGFRTKIAVHANDESIDPVGACVGLKGMRVNSIVDEINGEKIDIIVWSSDIGKYISNSLSPAEVKEVIVDESGKSAVAIVPDNQLSLAIGKEGQNVRLAAKLTGWKIDIKGESKRDEAIQEFKDMIEQREALAEQKEDTLASKDDVEEILVDEVEENEN
ncbi:MAG: transcription termination/antitermination protein NusA [Tissierellia bacterium]|nr:transcription termination/antitermination protein NusA [Tissierellia bacterium]